MTKKIENLVLRGVPTKSKVTTAVVCHIGAREHYGVARALHQNGQLEELITDIWIQPYSGKSRLPFAAVRRLCGRYHPDLRRANITHFTASRLASASASTILRPNSHWDCIERANLWFQARAARRVDQILRPLGRHQQPVVIAYSYAALQILEVARGQGARTVLCQIDGGEADARLIEKIAIRKGAAKPDHPPPSYWAKWRRECEIADRIIVNSDWSRSLLADAAVPVEKISVVPVIHQPKNTAKIIDRKPPYIFNRARPLKALFLGALSLRKGIHEVLAAARELLNEPVEFHLVGADREGYLEAAWKGSNIKIHGHVPRAEVGRFYREADVFLFPTHSDGFGIVQLEAMNEGLPVIASRNCAVLVEHETSGILLDDISGESLVKALLYCLADPARLARMGVAAQTAVADYAGTHIQKNLEKILGESNTIEQGPDA